ncbi:hypothetical protein [Nostoc sp. XA010]|nr:hypothetical protein [Nostoc sp. XA010]
MPKKQQGLLHQFFGCSLIWRSLPYLLNKKYQLLRKTGVFG